MNYISIIFDGMQSWSIDGKFKKRFIENVPTKSGVIGLILNAMGDNRDNQSLLSVLSSLPIDTFVLSACNLEKDYQIANSPKNVNPVVQASGGLNKSPVIIEKDYYPSMITGAILEIEDSDLCESIINALKYPVRCLYFGRKNHIPNKELLVGVFENYMDAVKGLINSVEKDEFEEQKEEKEKIKKTVDEEVFYRQDLFGVRDLNSISLFNSSIKSIRDLPVDFDKSNRIYTERLVVDSSFNKCSLL